MSISPNRRQRYGEEGEGLFHDDMAIGNPYLDEFHDEDDVGPPPLGDDENLHSPSKVVRRGRWKRWAMICLCALLVVIGVAMAVVVGSMMGSSDDNDTKADSSKGVSPPDATEAPVATTVTMTLAPVPAPPPKEIPTMPTPAPTTTAFPTRTAFPTSAVYWYQVGQDFGTDALEYMGSAVDISADGSVVWYGSFNYTDATRPATVGRIRRMDVATGKVTEVYGTHEMDSFGYTVSGSDNGEFVAAFASSNGTVLLYDYLAAQDVLRLYAQATLPSSWDPMTVVFDLSKDGQWLAVTGTEVRQGEPGDDEIDWKLRIYQVVTGSGGSLVQYGGDVTVQASLDVAPKLYAIEMSHDGAVVAVSVVGVDREQWGRVRVYKRESDDLYSLLGNLAGDSLLSSNAAGASDFFGRRMQIRVIGGQVWLAIGWEGQNTILMRTWNAAAGVWQDEGQLSASAEEYGEDAEFGYDFDISVDGTRMVVGVRCFNFCRGADQVFQLIDGEWKGLGQIVVGYEDTFFGEAVGISADGTTVIVGAPEDCNVDNPNVCGGSVYVYEYQGPELPGGVLTRAPVSANIPTQAPSPEPTVQTMWPTRTSMPTYAFGWEQINGVFDSVDQELFASAVSLSGDGSVLFIGAFENGQYAPESGRIVRIDLADENSELVVYGDAYDFLGFDISSSRDGSRVVGYLSSSSLIEVADYNPASGLLEQTAQLSTGFNSTSATFSLSADGQWLAGVGVIDSTGFLTIKSYQLSSTGEFVPFGQDISLQYLETAPTLDIHLLFDGSYMAISIAGWNGYVGQVRIYRRTETGWEQAGTDLTSDVPNDFFGKTIRLAQTAEKLTLLFIGAPYNNEVKVFQLTENGSEWDSYGLPITAGEDFTDEDEFGFDIDTSTNGQRVVVGIRCFDSCRGAAQVFEHDGAEFQPLGQIIAGFADSYFGEAVDCDEDCNIIAVGAPEDCSEDGTSCGGSVYVFQGNDNRGSG